MSYEEFLNAKRSVLVVWDVQNALVSRIFNKEEFMSSLGGVLSSARGAGVPVIFTKITPLPDKYESRARKYLSSRWGPRGNLPVDWSLALQPKSDDYVLNKNTASLFTGTPVEIMLRNAGIETLILTGISTDIGVLATAWDAYNRGFLPVVIKDAVSSSDKKAHEEALDLMTKQFLVLDSGELANAWRKED